MPKGFPGRSKSLKWPHLYDILVGQGYSHESAARISNAERPKRKKGRLNVHGRKVAAKYIRKTGRRL